MKSNKSLFLTYVFWLFGGLFGLHHFYLNRYRHAFAQWISFGGYFGVGWIRDLWRIPEYVLEANEDPEYMVTLIDRMRRQPKPSFGIIRFLASVIVADILGYLVMGAIPHELFSDSGSSDNLISRVLTTLFVPLGCAIGVHIVGNVGRYSGSIKWPLIAAYITCPLYYYQMNLVGVTSIISIVVFVKYSLCWRRTPVKSQSNFCVRYSILFFCIILYCSLWCSWFYFNCSVTDKNEENIKCRDALRNFFNSPAWLEFTSVLKKLVLFIRTEGILGLWKEIVEAMDPQGEKNALKILELDEDSSQETITANYRKLARQWHPDKHSDPENKKHAQERFMAIQEAYDLLSSMKQKRLKKQLS